MSSQPNPQFPKFLADSFHIETPEQIQLQFRLAGVGSRFLAMAVDTLWQMLAIFVFGTAYAIVSAATGYRPPQWATALVILIIFLLYSGYFAIFEFFWKGQTPGKRVAGIRVIKESGRSLTAVETIGRNLMRIVDQIPGFYAVGVISAAISPQGKRLGDYVAGSIVVHERSMEEIRTSWRHVMPSPNAAIANLGGNRLTPDEVALIETFLVRRDQLVPDVRRRMATEILNRLASKLTLSDDDRAGVEATLERLVHEHRG
jgi:uncharacterized RDD family membrane protein YckC